MFQLSHEIVMLYNLFIFRINSNEVLTHTYVASTENSTCSYVLFHDNHLHGEGYTSVNVILLSYHYRSIKLTSIFHFSLNEPDFRMWNHQ